jgi:hypothetical protein
LAFALGAAATFWALIKVCGADLKAYALALFWLATAGPAVTLIEQAEPGLRWNGIAAILMALAAGLLFARWRALLKKPLDRSETYPTRGAGR